jgi:hypothetical protein
MGSAGEVRIPCTVLLSAGGGQGARSDVGFRPQIGLNPTTKRRPVTYG